ncbi:MAG: S8 family serine peptidase [Pyrinomonadaceae bacterium]|nr:S8 family serine peptidase [Pyrinomonadaceae bacterium]
MKKALITTALLALALMFSVTGEATNLPGSSAARVDPALISYLASQGLNAKLPAVITYSSRPGSAEFNRLQSIGIAKGFALRQLPMVIADLSLVQVNAVKTQPGVVSVWANRAMKPFTNTSRRFIGVPQMMGDTAVTMRNTQNPGMPVSGKGIGIGYIDTGIDGTQEDLKYGTKTRQNVIQPMAHGDISDAGLVGVVYIPVSDMIAGTGFVPPIYVENVQTSDIESGHGTHGAGVAAGTGANSGGFYGGVAPGAHLVGIDSGDDKGLPLVAILGSYDYLLDHQTQYNIRVINNSWGGSYAESEVSPDNPINVATRAAHDRNIVVVFAAGNAGDTPTSINPYSTMPWTISVAAGEKQGFGSPASFSSRGINNGTGTDVAGMPANPLAQPNLRPDITAPGVGIISVRAHGVSALMNASGILNGDPVNIPAGYQPYYLSSQGTSFACPHVSGVVALMLEANSSLTPDQVVTILRQTANPMPYEERVVGAGYVDAHNAVRQVMGLSAVPHPANLFPPPDLEIADIDGDQLGTAAQDIISADFAYNAAAQQVVYTLTLKNLSARTANNQWYIGSNFGTTTLFVSAATTETGGMSYQFGKITLLPNGTRNQEDVTDASGNAVPVDSGQVVGNQIIIKLSINKLNRALDVTGNTSVVGSTSTATEANAQILVGTTVTGGLLLRSDNATGRDFYIGN